MHELPLVFFTVLGQSAAGLYLLAYASRRLGMLSENQLRHANIAAFVIMIIALVIGGLHVGQPLRFFNMLLGVGRSPMSNEALLSGIFVAFGAATLLFTLFIKNKVLSELCNVATVIFGLAFVWSNVDDTASCWWRIRDFIRGSAVGGDGIFDWLNYDFCHSCSLCVILRRDRA